MRRSIVTLLGVTLLASAPLAAQAKEKDLAISIGGPGYSFTYVDPGYRPAYGYHRPAPVYYAPRPVYVAPPVYYTPRPDHVAPYWDYRYGHRHHHPYGHRHGDPYRRY